MTSDDSLARSFAAECASSGFDLVHAFRIDWWNREAEPAERLPDLGRSGGLGLLVGNTRALWPVFLRALREDSRLHDDPHPLERWAIRAITRAATRTGVSYAMCWAHDTHPAFPIQRLAQATGLAVLSPSHLCVHATYGPWIALRAVVVLDAPGPDGAAPIAADPCARCKKPCLDALRVALRESGSTDARAVETAWRLWAKVRDVCPEGPSHRYGDDQVRYHYAKDRTALEPVSPRDDSLAGDRPAR